MPRVGWSLQITHADSPLTSNKINLFSVLVRLVPPVHHACFSQTEIYESSAYPNQ